MTLHPQVRTPWRVGSRNDEFINTYINMSNLTIKKDHLDTPTTGEAVKDLEAAFAVPQTETAAWTVVQPKGKSNTQKGAGKRTTAANAAIPSTSTRPQGANAPRGKSDSKLPTKQHGSGQRVVTPKVDPGPSQYRKNRHQVGSSIASTSQPHAPSARAAGLPAVTAEPVGRRGGGRTKYENRHNRQRRKAVAIARAAQAPAHSEPNKRMRADDTVSPRGVHKKQRVESTRRAPASYAEATQSNLQVAVVRADNQHITEEQATQVKKYLEGRILSDIKDPQVDYSPSFIGRPTIMDGALKLWCEDDASLEWLNRAINQLPASTCPRLRVIKQSELSRRVSAAIFIPECTNSLEDTSLVLANQNKWAKVNTWTVHHHKMQENDVLFIAVGIPETVIPEVMKRGRRMAHNLGSIYVRFYAKDGALQDTPPSQQQADTEQALAGPSVQQVPGVGQVPELATPAHSSPKPSCSKPMEVMDDALDLSLDLDNTEGEGSHDDGDPSPI